MSNWPLGRLRAAAPLVLAALALSQCSQPAPESAGGDAAEFNVVATNDQIMDAIVIPNAQAIWDAVVWVDGVLVASPETDDDWYNLQMNAYAVAEAGNLLKMAPRARDGDWMTFSTQLTETSREAVRAAEAKDIDALLEAGGNIYNVCTDCHRQYVTPDPNAPEPEIPGLGPGGPVETPAGQ